MKHLFHSSTTAYIRLDLGLTQQQLADSLGISRSTLAMAETGRRPMPEFAVPLLREMMAIAKKMPAPQHINWRHNRVHQSIRLHTFGKKPIVTGQSSAANSYLGQALTKYTPGENRRPSFSTQVLESQSDCQKLINGFSVKKDRLHYQLEYLRLEARIAVNRGREINAQLQFVNTMIACHLQIMDQCPSHKRKLEHHNARLYCKKLLLEDRVEHFDAPAMLLREHTINVMVRQLELLVGFVTAIEERKVALAGNNLQLVKRNWEPSCLKEDVFTPFARAC